MLKFAEHFVLLTTSFDLVIVFSVFFHLLVPSLSPRKAKESHCYQLSHQAENTPPHPLLEGASVTVYG